MKQFFPSSAGAGRGGNLKFSERDDIEMSFIRTLSVNGLILGGAISAEDRRERIRLAIFNQKLDAAPFDADMSFAQAYTACYNRPLDLRRDSRHGAVDASVIAEKALPMGADDAIDEDDADDEDEAA